MSEIKDLVIVGAGPVGLFASFYAGMRGLNTVVTESRSIVGGALSAIYPEKYIYDMVGFPKILAQDLIDNLYKQSSHFDNEIMFNTTIVDIIKNSENVFELTSQNGEVLYSKTVLIASGMGAFSPRKVPALKSAEKYEAQEYSGVKYLIKDKEKYYGQRVVVVGGGNSALDWAHDFDGNSISVTLVHREDEWQAHEESITRLPQSGIKVYQPYAVAKAIGEEKLEAIVIEHIETKEKITLECDLLVGSIGFLPNKSKFEHLPLKYVAGAIEVDPATLESKEVGGLFAAGDACTFEGKLKLIVVGAAEAAVAVNHIVRKVDSKASIKPTFSSNFFTDDFSKGKK